MALPVAGYHATGPNVTGSTTALDDTVAFIKQLVGGADESELTIATGSVTATIGMHTIDTEGNGSSDDLDNIVITGVDSFLLLIRAENAARVVTLKHESGGAGQISLKHAQDLVLDATSKYVLFWLDTGASPTTLREVARFGFDAPGELEVNTAVTASPNILTADENGKAFSNEGTAAMNFHTLPGARAGLSYGPFVVQDGNGLRVTAAAGDTIRVAASPSPAAGYIEATTVGNVVSLLAINATEWIAVATVGTWTVSA